MAIQDNDIHKIDPETGEPVDEAVTAYGVAGNPLTSALDANGEDINNVGAVDTGTLTDSDDGSAWETLREAGFETGEPVPIATLGNMTTNSVSTSSTSFTGAEALYQSILQWNTYKPNSNVQLQTRIMAKISPGTDETAELKIRDFDSNEDVTQVLSVTSSGLYASSWSDFDPSSLNTQNRVFAKMRSDPGNNSSSFEQLLWQIAVKL